MRYFKNIKMEKYKDNAASLYFADVSFDLLLSLTEALVRLLQHEAFYLIFGSAGWRLLGAACLRVPRQANTRTYRSGAV